jgi:hypothetical protein
MTPKEPPSKLYISGHALTKSIDKKEIPYLFEKDNRERRKFLKERFQKPCSAEVLKESQLPESIKKSSLLHHSKEKDRYILLDRDSNIFCVVCYKENIGTIVSIDSFDRYKKGFRLSEIVKGKQ